MYVPSRCPIFDHTAYFGFSLEIVASVPYVKNSFFIDRNWRKLFLMSPFTFQFHRFTPYFIGLWDFWESEGAHENLQGKFSATIYGLHIFRAFPAEIYILATFWESSNFSQDFLDLKKVSFSQTNATLPPRICFWAEKFPRAQAKITSVLMKSYWSWDHESANWIPAHDASATDGLSEKCFLSIREELNTYSQRALFVKPTTELFRLKIA